MRFLPVWKSKKHANLLKYLYWQGYKGANLSVERYLHNSQLTKANADNEAIHNAFSNGWLWKVMDDVNINFYHVLQ